MKRIIYKNCKVDGRLTDIEVTDGIFTAIAPLCDDGIVTFISMTLNLNRSII